MQDHVYGGKERVVLGDSNPNRAVRGNNVAERNKLTHLR